jgi:hypothetical protein
MPLFKAATQQKRDTGRVALCVPAREVRSMRNFDLAAVMASSVIQQLSLICRQHSLQTTADLWQTVQQHAEQHGLQPMLALDYEQEGPAQQTPQQAAAAAAAGGNAPRLGLLSPGVPLLQAQQQQQLCTMPAPHRESPVEAQHRQAPRR